MLCEAFRRLSFFTPLENYRYIGFGSTTFTDFTLIHKTLAITDMISIEKRANYKARFEFNRPFQCIQMEYGSSNKVLPELAWDKRVVVWLDYEGHLTDSELRDVAYIVMNAASGSMLVVSLNVSKYMLSKERESKLGRQGAELEKLKVDVGSDKVPGDIVGKNLEGWDMAHTFRRLIMNEIDQVLRDRNGLHSVEHKAKYQPLFNLHYKDQARMLTVGGVLYQKLDEANLRRCQFEDLDFVSIDASPYKIEMPVLTPREQRYLDRKLPQGAIKEAIEKVGLTEKEIQNYARVYRYCPTFVDVELS
ncbi:hypothetical protein ES708_17056 [subsurface metagenome]